MSRICTICDKKAQQGVTLVKLRGKYNPTQKVKKYPNLQWLTLSSGERIKACTRCIKTYHKKTK